MERLERVALGDERYGLRLRDRVLDRYLRGERVPRRGDLDLEWR
jgi:hypothetical protein